MLKNENDTLLETFFCYASVTVVIGWNEKHDDIIVKVLKDKFEDLPRVPCTAREIAREAISKLLKINLEAIWLVEERLLNYWPKVIGNNLLITILCLEECRLSGSMASAFIAVFLRKL